MVGLSRSLRRSPTRFDILIDLELEPVLPLKFVIRKSTAGMKVGVDGTEWCEDLDFIVPSRRTTRSWKRWM